MSYVVIVAIITGVVQVVKKSFGDKYTQIVALIFGVAAGLLFVEGDIGTQVFLGLSFGLGSMGLFDLSKITKNKGISEK